MFIIFELLFILGVLWLIVNLMNYFIFRAGSTPDNPIFCLSAKWIKDEEASKAAKNTKK